MSGDDIWEQRYAGGHEERYPWDAIVSFVMRNAPADRPHSAVRILEVGCGTGNNLWFAAREGFAVAGIDGSASAIAKARERFAADGLQGAFHHGDFTALPFADASFAMALDRAALTCVGRGVMRVAVTEIRRVLEPGGLFHCHPYSDRHGAAAMGRAADDGLVTDIAAGGLANVGPICFYGREALLAQFPTPAWEIVSLRHMELTEVAPGDEVQAEWRLVARKTGS